MDVEEKVYSMSYSNSHYAVMANAIIKGKQQMTLLEARLIRILITQIVKQDNDLKTYTCRIKDLAGFLGIPQNNLYRDVKDIIEKLSQRIIKVGTNDPKRPWKILTWLDTADYDGKGTITLKVSNGLKPYLIDLNDWFTQYQLKEILSMSSFYAIRLYELLKMSEGETREKGRHEFTIDYLRGYFGIEDKFERLSDLKRKVLDVAQREINENTDLWVDYEYIKTARMVTSIVFLVRRNDKVLEARQAEEVQEGTQVQFEQEVLSVFGIKRRGLSEREQKYIATWRDEYRYDIDIIKLAYDRMIDKIGKVSWPYVAKILEEWHVKGYATKGEIRSALNSSHKATISDEGFPPSLDISAIENEIIYNTPTIPDIMTQDADKKALVSV